MKGHGSKFSRKMEAAAVAMLTQRTVDEAARSVGISTATLMRWQKTPEFQTAYREAKRAAYSQSIARMHQMASAAVSTLAKIMLDRSSPASTRVRAADNILNHTAKAIEVEDIEARVAQLERVSEAESESG